MKKLLLSLLAVGAFATAQAETSCTIGTPCAFPAGASDVYFNQANTNGAPIASGRYLCDLTSSNGTTSAVAIAYAGGTAVFDPVTVKLGYKSAIKLDINSDLRNSGSNPQIKFVLQNYKNYPNGGISVSCTGPGYSEVQSQASTTAVTQVKAAA